MSNQVYPEFWNSSNETKTSYDNSQQSVMFVSSNPIGMGTSNPEKKLIVTSSKIYKKRKFNAEVGVGAGSEIYQDLEIDTLSLKDWEEKPASIMRLYFVFLEQFQEISQKGMKDLTGKKEGYLNGLLVG